MKANDVDFNVPFEVTAAGEVRLATQRGLSVPEVSNDPGGDITIHGTGWTALIGFTSQYSYRGAVMHPSEYLGGRLERFILDNPGVYAVTEVRSENLEYPETPIGWVVLRLVEG